MFTTRNIALAMMIFLCVVIGLKSAVLAAMTPYVLLAGSIMFGIAYRRDMRDIVERSKAREEAFLALNKYTVS